MMIICTSKHKYTYVERYVNFTKKGETGVCDEFRIIFYTALAWNAAVFLIYGIDKYKAKKGLRRISERALVTAALFFGGAGALCGMVVFNHKTSKIKFRILIPLSFIILFSALCFAKAYFLK